MSKPFQIIYQIHNNVVRCEPIKFNNPAIRTETVDFESVDDDDEPQLQIVESIECEEVDLNFDSNEVKLNEDKNEQFFVVEDEPPRCTRKPRGTKRKSSQQLEQNELKKLAKIHNFTISLPKSQNTSSANQKSSNNVTMSIKQEVELDITDNVMKIDDSHKFVDLVMDSTEPSDNELKIDEFSIYDTLEIVLGEQSSEETSSYTCTICNGIFRHENDLIVHVERHKDSKFQCKTCLHLFKRQSFLDRHVCITCEICGEFFPSSQAKRHHIKSQHEDVAPEKCYMLCDLCGRRFSIVNRVGLIHHIKKAHWTGYDFNCDFCERIFKTKECLRRHLQSIHEDDVNCEFCNKSMKQIHLGHHIRSVHSIGRFSCPICSVTFKSKVCMKSHIKNIHERIFECSKCDKKFAHKSDLLNHEEWHDHPDKFTCKYCGKQFGKVYVLKNHIQQHEDGVFSRLKCTRCTYTTHCEKNLEKHEAKHVRQDMFIESKKNWIKCELCPQYLKNKLKFASHMWKRHHQEMVM